MIEPIINKTGYICDVCGRAILNVDDAFLAWHDNRDNHRSAYGGFFIAHRTCLDKFCLEMDLRSAIHIDGLAKLIVMLEQGIVADIASFAEVMKRLYLPHYEEARKYFPMADADGFHAGASSEAILTQQNLLDVIRKYSPKNDLD